MVKSRVKINVVQKRERKVSVKFQIMIFNKYYFNKAKLYFCCFENS